MKVRYIYRTPQGGRSCSSVLTAIRLGNGSPISAVWWTDRGRKRVHSENVLLGALAFPFVVRETSRHTGRVAPETMRFLFRRSQSDMKACQP